MSSEEPQIGGFVSAKGLSFLSAGEPVIPLKSDGTYDPITITISGNISQEELREVVIKAFKKALRSSSVSP